MSNSAFAIFNATAGAEEYIITATNSQGVIQTFGCNSTIAGACSLPQLMCSQNLTFTVQAKDQQCTSPRSNAVKTETGKLKHTKPFYVDAKVIFNVLNVFRLTRLGFSCRNILSKASYIVVVNLFYLFPHFIFFSMRLKC